jgi:Domain of unknown function (DUF305)
VLLLAGVASSLPRYARPARLPLAVGQLTHAPRTSRSSAIVAGRRTDDPEIREIANNIVSAQEIEQMERWRQQWYPQG